MTQNDKIPEELRHLIPGFGNADSDGAGATQAMALVSPKDFPATAISEREQAEHSLRLAWERFAGITYQINVDKGFMEPGREVLAGDQFMLMVCELAEGYEAHRKDLNDDKLTHRNGKEVELADAVIRIMNYARHRGLDVVGAIIEKTRFNETRP
ncbi:MAG: hypothetical protein NDJ92_20615, partial [Thermoanaerobaculia bacterium]|nr:hypothetical protein [Thermoanaerobaculia bacterium]